LLDRDVSIQLTDEANAWLAKRGYDRMFGARPLARVIQDHIKKPLAEELLFGKLVNGGAIAVKMEDDKLAFDIVPNQPRGKQKPKGKKGPKDPGPDEERKINEYVE
jgi:ATP-dependent Clp protease ATP-binding subunit ClpA